MIAGTIVMTAPQAVVATAPLALRVAARVRLVLESVVITMSKELPPSTNPVIDPVPPSNMFHPPAQSLLNVLPSLKPSTRDESAMVAIPVVAQLQGHLLPLLRGMVLVQCPSQLLVQPRQ